MKYQKWHIGTASEQDTALLKEAGYPSLLATVLAARGITTAEAAAEALERETSLTISPMLMRDMRKPHIPLNLQRSILPQFLAR